MGDFGELRSLLHRETSSSTFDELIAMFSAAEDPDEAERVWLPYALERVSSWLPIQRRLPVRALSPGERPPAWVALACHLDLSTTTYSDAFLHELVTSSIARNLRSLSYAAARAPEGLLGWIVGSEHLGALESLSLQSLRGEGVAQAMEALGEMRLGSLSLRWCDVGDHGLRAFIRCASPILHALDLSACGIGDDAARDLARSPTSRSITSLTLSDNRLASSCLVELARQPGAPLRKLDLQGNPIGDEGVVALARSGRLDGVNHLGLSACGVGDGALLALVESGALREVRTLEMRRDAVTDVGALALAEAEVPELRDLYLEANAIGARGALALLRSPNMPALSSLDMSENDCEDDAFEVPEDRSQPASLRQVDLSSCEAGPRLIEELVRTRALETVTSLSLRDDMLDPSAARALGASERLGSLIELDLEDCALMDDGFEALFAPGAGERFRALAVLDIGGNELTDASSRVLEESGLSGLRQLTACDNLFGSPWVEALAQNPASQTIEDLWLTGCLVDDEGAEALANSPNLSALVLLDVSGTMIESRGLRALFGSPVLEGLRTFNTSAVGADDVFKALAANPQAASLRTLRMSYARFDEVTWRELATSTHLSALSSFSFRGGIDTLLDVLSILRAEGARLNPWTHRHRPTRQGDSG